jgi:hypothetical protein
MVFMPKALATLTLRWPSLPRPRVPRVRPSRSWPGLAGLHAGVLEADAAGEFQDQAEGDAGGGAADAAGAADRDAALGAGLQVDGGVAGAGGDQEFQVGQAFDDLAGERGALAHHLDDGEALQGLDDRIVIAQGRAEDLDVDVLGDRGPIGKREGNVLIVVENGGANHTHGLLGLCRGIPGGANLEPVNRKDRGYQRAARLPFLAWQAGPGPRI